MQSTAECCQHCQQNFEVQLDPHEALCERYEFTCVMCGNSFIIFIADEAEL